MAKAKAKPPAERAARKPIPRTIQAWVNELTGCIAFAMKKAYMLESSGQAWLDSMQGYYLERVTLLGKNIPPGMKKVDAERHLAEVKRKLR